MNDVSYYTSKTLQLRKEGENATFCRVNSLLVMVFYNYFMTLEFAMENILICRTTENDQKRIRIVESKGLLVI